MSFSKGMFKGLGSGRESKVDYIISFKGEFKRNFQGYKFGPSMLPRFHSHGVSTADADCLCSVLDNFAPISMCYLAVEKKRDKLSSGK